MKNKIIELLKEQNELLRKQIEIVNNYPSHDFGIFYSELEKFGLNVTRPSDYSHWDKVWKLMLPYVEDDCSSEPKITKTIKLVDPC